MMTAISAGYTTSLAGEGVLFLALDKSTQVIMQDWQRAGSGNRNVDLSVAIWGETVYLELSLINFDVMSPDCCSWWGHC